MSMPVMDGMSATRAIREYEQTHNMMPCCIIALTGLASSSAKLEAWSSGIDHFMTKPVNFKELGEILKSKEGKRPDIKRPVLTVRPATASATTDTTNPVSEFVE
jgi:CheY-like chemotaxis protein